MGCFILLAVSMVHFNIKKTEQYRLWSCQKDCDAHINPLDNIFM